MAHLPLTADDVRDRLDSARRRKDELIALNGGNLPGADPHHRQQLVQEFFFHLVGAIEVLAQRVDEARKLGLGVEDATASAVIRDLPQTDRLWPALAALYVKTRKTRQGQPVPSDPYSDEGVMYRIWNYRHQVTHRRGQPFDLRVGVGTAIDFGPGLRGRWRTFRHRRNPNPATLAPPSTAHFILDPRDPPGVRTASRYTVPDELERMLQLISTRCEAALAVI